MNILFSWLENPGIIKAIKAIYNAINVIRVIIPIALIVMTVFDILKKVINPDDKEGQKKIMRRALAALIIFFIPTFIKLVFTMAHIDLINIDIDSNQVDVDSNDDNDINANNNSINDGENKVSDYICCCIRSSAENTNVWASCYWRHTADGCPTSFVQTHDLSCDLQASNSRD